MKLSRKSGNPNKTDDDDKTHALLSKSHDVIPVYTTKDSILNQANGVEP